MSRHASSLLPLLILVSALSFAKKPDLVMMWPPENPTLKLTFGTFHDMGSYAGKMTLVSDVTVQNLSAKVMPRASFNVSLLDRNSVRLGNGLLIIEDLNPGQSAKIQFQCTSVGQPAMLNLAARNSGGMPTSTKAIPITIVSVPPGAMLKVDDQAIGMTPVTVRMPAGTHNLELHKEGYADAKTPLDVSPDEAPGGSITITLGGLASDTIELRDGSILNGDVISMSLEAVVINVQGKEQMFERNRIKKMFLVERTVTHVTVPETPVKTNPPATDSQIPHR